MIDWQIFLPALVIEFLREIETADVSFLQSWLLSVWQQFKYVQQFSVSDCGPCFLKIYGCNSSRGRKKEMAACKASIQSRYGSEVGESCVQIYAANSSWFKSE